MSTTDTRVLDRPGTSSPAPMRFRTAPPERVTAFEGPRLLAGLDDGPSLAAHRERFGPPPSMDLDDMVSAIRAVAVRGRGGAGFPFATKLATAARRRRRVVVVNIAEGEPASAKDAALALFVPHRVLDGAVAVARALGSKDVHLVLPGDRPSVVDALTTALAERIRAGERVRWHLHHAAPGFVSGQARAVLELMAGRLNLPVTAWTPEAVHGHRGRPTLLSNAETWAQVGALLRLGPDVYAATGTVHEAGTTLVTVGGDQPETEVLEVPYGTPWSHVLSGEEMTGPVLLGGYHGTWAAPGQLADLTVSRTGLADAGLALGAGVVLPLPPGVCPVARTAAIVRYLAGQSAGRCGPCVNGLPALADAVAQLDVPRDRVAASEARRHVDERVGLVERRGACAHPDGTVRLVRSLLTSCSDEVSRHAEGRCGTSSGAGSS